MKIHLNELWQMHSPSQPRYIIIYNSKQPEFLVKRPFFRAIIGSPQNRGFIYTSASSIPSLLHNEHDPWVQSMALQWRIRNTWSPQSHQSPLGVHSKGIKNAWEHVLSVSTTQTASFPRHPLGSVCPSFCLPQPQAACDFVSPQFQLFQSAIQLTPQRRLTYPAISLLLQYRSTLLHLFTHLENWFHFQHWIMVHRWTHLHVLYVHSLDGHLGCSYIVEID